MLIHADGQPSAGARQVLPDDATRVDHMANDKYLPIDQCQVGISNSAAFIILCDATGQQHRFQLSKRASLELAAHMADVTEKLGYR
jgi:hypothetical protein